MWCNVNSATLTKKTKTHATGTLQHMNQHYEMFMFKLLTALVMLAIQCNLVSRICEFILCAKSLVTRITGLFQ